MTANVKGASRGVSIRVQWQAKYLNTERLCISFEWRSGPKEGRPNSDRAQQGSGFVRLGKERLSVYEQIGSPCVKP
jgi:hypothetical protein